MWILSEVAATDRYLMNSDCRVYRPFTAWIAVQTLRSSLSAVCKDYACENQRATPIRANFQMDCRRLTQDAADDGPYEYLSRCATLNSLASPTVSSLNHAKCEC
jgi:hypothetical protein